MIKWSDAAVEAALDSYERANDWRLSKNPDGFREDMRLALDAAAAQAEEIERWKSTAQKLFAEHNALIDTKNAAEAELKAAREDNAKMRAIFDTVTPIEGEPGATLSTNALDNLEGAICDLRAADIGDKVLIETLERVAQQLVGIEAILFPAPSTTKEP